MQTSDDVARFDSVLNALKWNGRYQLLQLGLMMSTNLPAAFNLMSIVFIGYHVPSQCKELNDTSMFMNHGVKVNISSANITYGECEITISSNQSHLTENIQLTYNGYEYHQPRDLSLNFDWDLVCGKESLSDLLQTFYTIGMGIGSVVFIRLADRKGRKVANCLAGFTFFAVSTSMAFVPSYIPFAVLKLLQGSAEIGTTLTATTISLEIVPTDYRALVGVIFWLVWSICLTIYAGAAYLMRDLSWRQHQFIAGLIPCYYLLMPCTLDESFRWLIVKGKKSVIERNLKKAAHMNGENREDIVDVFRAKKLLGDNQDGKYEPKKITKHAENGELLTKNPFVNTFRDKHVMLIMCIIWFLWLSDSFSYFGLSWTATEFHSDPYVGFALGGVVEVICPFAFLLTVDRFGRKGTSLGFHLFGGISLIASAVFQHFTGRFSVATTYSMLWLYTPEIFPTSIRNFAFGLASLAARLGGIFAPFSRTIHRRYPWALAAILGVLSIIASLLIRFLLETGGQELPQTVADMKKLVKIKTLAKKKKTKKSSKNDHE